MPMIYTYAHTHNDICMLIELVPIVSHNTLPQAVPVPCMDGLQSVGPLAQFLQLVTKDYIALEK